jgi:ribosomal protein S12 methylthiotransferase accessory factor
MTMRDTLGITRVADITGLDVLGIPVVQAVRPFSLSNAVSQGKGATTAEAAISAIMESAESCFAERLANYEATVASANCLNIPPERFEAHLQDGVDSAWRERQTAWVSADNLLGGGHRDWVPLELVHTAYVLPPHPHDGIFASSTTGLAASFEETDAILHGILECVERDALARAHRIHGFLQRCRIDPRTIDHPAVADILEALAVKGLLVGLWHAPSPLGLPVVWCHLMEDRSAETALLHHPADGSAAAFDPAAAIAHAIYEAAQSRLAAISGARDDITRASYPKYPDWQKIAAHRRLLSDGPRDINFHALAEQRISRVADRLPALVAALDGAGIDKVHMVRLDTTPVDCLSAVKIVIPALKPLLQG